MPLTRAPVQTAMRSISCARRGLSTRGTLVGFVGAGNMGRGMAASLTRAGMHVTQYDRDPKALAASADQSELIREAATLQELCAAHVLVVSVAGEAAERAVYLGPDGVVAQLARGSLLIGCGTTTVDFAREVHAAADAKGVRFLDAPVSGGPEGARLGTLSIMCGGEEATFVDAKPVLEGMGGYVVRMGAAGAGAAAKLVNQQLTASNALAATEGLALAQAMGMKAADIAPLLQLLERSWGNSTMLQRTGGIVQAALASSDTRTALSVDAPAPLRNFAKDLDFVLSAATSAGLSLPSTRAARDAVSRAAALGLDASDWAMVSEFHRHDAPRAAVAAPPPAASLALPASRAAVFDSLTELTASLPSEWHEGERALLLRNSVLAARKGTPLVVVDDDPTGTQTVHSVPVLADWSADALEAALREV